MVPSGSSGTCTGTHPIVMYAHGTNTTKTFNMAALSGNSEALLMASVFAAQGYIVVAPNYAGYDTSTSVYHPYLNADQQSKDMIDALAAARSAFSTASTSDNGKLFITGYSQGGFVAMATHKAMQAAGTTVTAAGPMSGPYALAAFGDAIFEGEVNNSGPLNFNMLVTSYQHSYGNVYSAPTDVYEAQYAPSAFDAAAERRGRQHGLQPRAAATERTIQQYAAQRRLCGHDPGDHPANLAPISLWGSAPQPGHQCLPARLSAGCRHEPRWRLSNSHYRNPGRGANPGAAHGSQDQRPEELEPDRTGAVMCR